MIYSKASFHGWAEKQGCLFKFGGKLSHPSPRGASIKYCDTSGYNTSKAEGFQQKHKVYCCRPAASENFPLTSLERAEIHSNLSLEKGG